MKLWLVVGGGGEIWLVVGGGSEIMGVGGWSRVVAAKLWLVVNGHGWSFDLRMPSHNSIKDLVFTTVNQL